MSTMAVQILLLLLGCTMLHCAPRSPPGPLPGNGPCFDAIARARADAMTMLGVCTPQCDRIGYFKPKQFCASTGYRWCATPDGKEIVNTKRAPAETEPVCDTDIPLEPDTASCWVANANTVRLPGAYIPQCDQKGNFKAKQCNLSTGYCWCAEPKGGAKIAGTETAPLADAPAGVGLNC